MKLIVLSAIIAPVLVSAHDVVHHHHARQAPSSAAASSGSAPASAPSSPAASAPVASSVAAASSSASSGAPPVAASSAVASSQVTAAPSNLPSLTFSLLSTNPTALPITAIASGMTTQATSPLSTTWTPGSLPTDIPGAPGLPNPVLLAPANYPPLDKTPPTDSALVQQWIQDVQNSGVTIPDFAPTVAGGCAANPQAAANTSRCWWTCGGCTRDTDIAECPNDLQWGLTYDDGPSPSTPALLQYLQSQDLRSTFFVVGSRAISYPFTLQEEYMGGHQISVHTWSHPYMTTMTNEQAIAELGWTKKVIKDITGVTPRYWRPPFGDIDDRIRAIAQAMDLTAIVWTRISATSTFDTGDYDVAGGTVSSVQVLNNWNAIMQNATTIKSGFIVLEHDLFPQTVDLAIDYILPQGLAHNPKFNITPVIECMGHPLSDSYIETNNNKTNPLPLANVTGSAGSQSSGASGQSKNGAQGLVAYAPGFATSAMGMVAGVAALLL
ncbi:glycoside hydrolase/deacetylase [Amylocystis lapponica]|nr:glycoside hydrolase/deacetylase [Amylocystis lapponica]